MGSSDSEYTKDSSLVICGIFGLGIDIGGYWTKELRLSLIKNSMSFHRGKGLTT